MTPRKIARYGWKPDLPDFRDLYYKDHHSPAALALKAVVSPVNPIAPHVVTNVTVNTGVGADGLPLAFSLRPQMPPVFDQGQLGSCTANAAALMFAHLKGKGPFSRLQIYYNERLMEGTVNSDSGAFVRDSIKVLVTIGAGMEADWPYIESKFTEQPPVVELNEAAQNKAITYSRLQSREDFRQCLSQGFPFVTGISVFSNFESDAVAQTGIIPMPTAADQMMGGHAVCVIGYNSNYNGLGDFYEVQNSWGDAWGDNGRFWLPAAYLENADLAADQWTVRS